MLYWPASRFCSPANDHSNYTWASSNPAEWSLRSFITMPEQLPQRNDTPSHFREPYLRSSNESHNRVTHLHKPCLMSSNEQLHILASVRWSVLKEKQTNLFSLSTNQNDPTTLKKYAVVTEPLDRLRCQMSLEIKHVCPYNKIKENEWGGSYM